MIRSFALMTAAAALAVAPAAAQAVSPRLAAPVADSEELGGGSLILPIAIAIGLIIVLYLAIESEEDNEIPTSP
jgi:hypothetical protein